MAAPRRFGKIRRLPSGRYQASYLGPDGIRRPAPDTFERKGDADRWLSDIEADLRRGDWIDPDDGRQLLRDFAVPWVAERAGLRPKTRQLYEGLVRLHIAPTLGSYALADITPARVRTWRAGLVDSGVGAVTVAKAYRLLRTIMETAVEDRLIRANPCQIKGAAVERSPERPTLTVAEVYALADAMPARYRLLILLATFCSLRFGELAALTRADVDSGEGWVSIRRAVVEMANGSLVTGAPKTAAGRRVVAIPSALLGDVDEHLTTFVDDGPAALMFPGPKRGPLRRSNFQKHWAAAVAATGLNGIHFHDLRHTGNTLTAQSGATMADLMARMGHTSTRAAQIYLHTTSRRDRKVADSLNALLPLGSAPVKKTRIDVEGS
jgi:integrase